MASSGRFNIWKEYGLFYSILRHKMSILFTFFPRIDVQRYFRREGIKKLEDHWSCIAYLNAEDMLN